MTSNREKAAADLISSLPDEWVSVDELRKYISDWREGLATAPRDEYEDEILDGLEDMLPASPAPRTMDEIEWDDAEHHLAEALFGDTRKVVMLARDTDEEGDWSEWINCRMEDGSTDLIEKAYLTPTGRKYRLIPDEDVPEGDPIEIAGDDHSPPAPEAVAEVVRLRRALEELRDCYRHREARSRERLESVTDEREQSHLARFEHMHRRTHEALTRILEGGSND